MGGVQGAGGGEREEQRQWEEGREEDEGRVDNQR